MARKVWRTNHSAASSIRGAWQASSESQINCDHLSCRGSDAHDDANSPCRGGLCAYLASDEAAFVTGANIAINGGQHMQ
jgi:hypothetical protein